MSRVAREPLNLDGRRVLVMGLGTRQGGVGVTRYLVRQGAEVTVTDLSSAEALKPALDALEGLPIHYRLGEHRDEDFDWAEMIVRNPGVPRDSSWLMRARKRGVPVEMEMSLFFRACPAPIIGITGTKGKTTTATLCARILSQMRPDTILAGNMGTSALDQLEQIEADTPVVIELSSWQLEGLAEYEFSPEIAVLTNISEDHLNRYDSMDGYIEAKRHITRFQREQDWFVVNRNDPACWASREITHAHVVPFGRLDADDEGAGVENGHLYWHRAGIRRPLLDASDLPFPGSHAVENALAASAAAFLAGAKIEHARVGLTEARGVPHRQEYIAEVSGITYINDTTATAPAAAIAALETFATRPIILIAGGAGKGANLERFARLAAHQAEGIVLLDGEETPNLASLLRSAGAERVSEPQTSMIDAVDLATRWARPGGIVLLSPACASFGLFRDEFDRGDQFRDVVMQIARTTAGGSS